MMDQKDHSIIIETRVYINCIVFILLILGIIAINGSYVYASEWNIDYSSPDKYREPGEQSKIASQETIDMIKSEFGDCSGLEGLRNLYLWECQEFSEYEGGGVLIGKTTIEQLLDNRNLSGCSDSVLVYSAVARYLGYPTIMVDAAGLERAEKFKLGMTTGFSGHVFVEVYIDPSWILIDPTSGKFIREYDASNPVIPITTGGETIGYYALLKGKDMWDYNVKEPDMLRHKLRDFAKSFDPNEIEIPSYNIEKFTFKTIATITTSEKMKVSSTTTIDTTASSATGKTPAPRIETEEVVSAKRIFQNLFLREYLFIMGIITITIVASGIVIMKKKSTRSIIQPMQAKKISQDS